MLRLLIKLFIWLVALTLGGWLVAQWKLKQDVEKFQRSIAPYAEFKYDGVSLDLLGELKIRNIELTPRPGNFTIEVGEVVASTGNLWSLLETSFASKEDEIPEHAYIKFENLLLPFADLANEIDSDEEDASLEILAGLECGPVKRIGARQLVQMGIAWITMHGELSTDYTPSTGVLTLSGVFDEEDLARREFRIDLGGIERWLQAVKKASASRSPAAKEIPKPRIDYAWIKDTDQGFNRKSNEYCAIKSDRSVDAFLNSHLVAVKNKLESIDLHPSAQALDAYSAYRQPNSVIEMSIQPQGSFELDSVKFYDMQELEDIAGLTIKVNGKTIKSPIPDWSWQKFQKLAEIRKQKKLDEKLAQQYESKVIVRSFKPQTLATTKLERGMRVRIKRQDGKSFVGKIAKFDNKTIWLDVKRGNGVLTMPLKRSAIFSFEVYE